MASTSTPVAAARIHAPGSTDSTLADGPNGFDRKWFMGTWGVAWSTLPMWNVSPPISSHLYEEMSLSSGDELTAMNRIREVNTVQMG